MLRFFVPLSFLLWLFASLSLVGSALEEDGNRVHLNNEFASLKELEYELGNIPPSPLVVLLAEDNAVIQLTMLRLLRELGHKITLVDNGEKAIIAVKAKIKEDSRFDIVLTDIEMPIMDGIIATEEIRKLPGMESVPIIALTACEDIKIKQKCLDSGMNNVLQKPLTKATLKALLGNYQKKN